MPRGLPLQEPGSAADIPLRPDVALGLWMSWMETNFGKAQDWTGSAKPWWQVTPDDLAGNMLAAGSRQLNEILARDPLLRSIDRMWNANPLREVIPVDWAEVARALRTVWLRSLADPATSLPLGGRAERQDLAVGDRDLERGRPALVGPRRAAAGRRRSQGRRQAVRRPGMARQPGLPDAQGHLPAGVRLPARAGPGGRGRLDDAERQRLQLPPPAVRRRHEPDAAAALQPGGPAPAMETGGASLADGARNLLNDLKEGRLTMVDTTAFAPGRNLAMTPGKVVFRNRLIELIQYDADDREGPRGAAAVHPALDQQVLHPRPAAQEQHGALPGRAGLHGVRGRWKNPDASMEDITFEDYMDLGPLAAARRDRATSPAAPPSTRSATASAARCWP